MGGPDSTMFGSIAFDSSARAFACAHRSVAPVSVPAQVVRPKSEARSEMPARYYGTSRTGHDALRVTPEMGPASAAPASTDASVPGSVEIVKM